MLSYVDAVTTATSSPFLPINSMIRSLGLGVVVQMIFVCLPKRTPNMI